MIDLFKLVGRIVIENKDANNNIDETTNKAESGGNQMTSAFKKIGAAVATYLAVDKIIDFGKSVVNAAAEVSAEVSAFEQIMGDYSNNAQAKLNEVADATGVVSSRLTPYMTSLTAKFKGLGFDIDEATTLATDGLSLASDAAAFWDKSLDDAMGGLNSFINGSYEGGEAIGLFANDTQLAAYAVKNGVVDTTKAWSSLDEATKQATRLQYAQDMYKLSGATGQAAKEADQYANVQANLEEKWRQFKAEIGEPILQNVVLPAMQNLSELVDKASTAFKDCSKWINDHKKELEIAKGVIIGLTTTIGTFLLIMNWGTIMSAAAGALGAVQKAMIAVNAAMAANPIGLVVSLIAGLVAAFIYFWNTSEDFRQFFYNLWDSIKEVFNGIVDAICSAWDSIKEWTINAWNTTVEWLKGLWDGTKTFFVDLWNGIIDWFKGLWDGLTSFFTTIWDGIVNIFTGAWDGISNACSTAWEYIKALIDVGIQFITNLITFAIDLWLLPWRFIWENFGTYLIQAWEWLKETVSNGINAVKDTISKIMKAIYTFFSGIWNTIATFFSNIWNTIYTYVSGKVSAIYNWIKDKFTAVKNKVTEVFNSVKTFISNVWNTIYTFISGVVTKIYNWIKDKFNQVKTVVTNIFNGIKSVATTVWNAIKTAISNVVNGIKNVVTNVFNTVKTVVSNVFNGIKTIATNVWNGIKTAISNVVNGIKNTVSNVFNGVKNTISNVFNGIKSVATNVWNTIKNAITGPVEKARDTVKGVIDKIKGFFNFSWSLPKLKMPHLSIDGEFSLMPPKVPKFGIEWYAEGGILTKPTAFGINPFSGKTMVGGEAGPEAIAPISELMDYVRIAVAESNGGMVELLKNIILIMTEFFPQFTNMQVVLEDGAIVGKLAPKLNEELGKIRKRDER